MLEVCLITLLAAATNQKWRTPKLSEKEQDAGFKQVLLHCPVKLLEVYDETIKEIYGNRRDALLDAIRDQIQKLEEMKRQREVTKIVGP
jgi:hypothetical protein